MCVFTFSGIYFYLLAIIEGMVTYCVGSARQKRAYFMRQSAAVLDNVEVVFCANVNGKNYFAYGGLPFAEFTVKSYLKYRTALCDGGANFALLDKLGIRLNERIGKLCTAQMRCVQYIERIARGECGTVVINLDGTRYSRKNAKFLNALLSVCKNAFVCVTDNRFVRRAKRIDRIMRFGKPCKTRAALYKANRLIKYCESKYGVAVTRVGVM